MGRKAKAIWVEPGVARGHRARSGSDHQAPIRISSSARRCTPGALSVRALPSELRPRAVSCDPGADPAASAVTRAGSKRREGISS
jgi:hypothetical protein